MSILATAVAIASLLCLIDLLLTFGVIRRLREHSELLTGRQEADRPVIGLAVGESTAAFAVTTVEGHHLTGPAGLDVVAFFSASCSLCPERVPVFADYVRKNRLGRDRVLAVVHGEVGEPTPYLGQLAEIANVRTEPGNGELATLFKVSGYPAFCLLDADGVIVASGFEPSALPAPVAE